MSEAVGFEVTEMANEMIASNRYNLVASASCSCGTSWCTCGDSGTYSVTYKYAHLYALCSGNTKGVVWWGSATTSLKYSGSEVEGDNAAVVVTDSETRSRAYGSYSETDEDWDFIIPGTTYDWSYTMGNDGGGNAHQSCSISIKEYEQGYNISITLRNTEPYPQPAVPVSVYVVPADGSGTILGKKEIIYDFSLNEEITLTPEYADGTTFPTKEYAIDRLDSSNGEYYVIVKVYDYLTIYRQKVRWAPDSLELI